jgi:stress response protein SCP2
LQGANQIKDYYSKFSLLEKFGHSNPKNDFNGEMPIVVPFWTAFPPAINQSLRDALARTDGNNRYVDNFKWPNLALGDRRYAYRAAYLESIMVACFATLRLAGYKRVNQLIATYPGAFTKKDTNNIDTANDQQRSQKVALADTTSYEQDLQNIVSTLAPQMGVNFTGINNKILLRSETCAALAGCKRNSHDIALTIDMGGGTTDIGLLIPLTVDGQETMQSYMASLRYAGNDLLKAIVAYDLTKPENKDKKRDTQLLDWKLNLREGAERGSGTDTQAYNRIAMAFFEGLFEYVFNLLAAYQTNLYDKPINVYLLGNGFRLAQYFCCAGAAGKEKEEELAFFKQMESQAKTVNALPNNITLELKQQGLDKKRALIEGVFNIKEGTPEGEQYLAIEKKGYDAQPLLLPCVRVSSSTAYTQPVLIEKKDMKDVKIAADRPTRESAFKLTNKYWQHQDVNPDALFTQIVLATDGADLGKFYLENKFVPEVLCKLVKEQNIPAPQQQQIQVNASLPAPPPTPPQQSGFKPSSVSESVAAPPAPNVPPQNPIQESSHRPNFTGQALVQLDQKGQRAKRKVGDKEEFIILEGKVTVRLGWKKPNRPTGSEFDIEPAVILLGADDKVTNSETDLVFFRQRTYGHNAIQVYSQEVRPDIDKDAPYITIDFSRLNAEKIRKISIWAFITQSEEKRKRELFGELDDLSLDVANNNQRMITVTLPKENYSQTALMFAEIYHTGDKNWKFKSGGQGYDQGFRQLCISYGLNMA